MKLKKFITNKINIIIYCIEYLSILIINKRTDKVFLSVPKILALQE
jgi:hypothetical protein